MLIVFGFSPANFIGVEQKNPHKIQVGYLSGRPSGNVALLFDVELSNDTAGNYYLPLLQLAKERWNLFCGPLSCRQTFPFQ